MVSQKADRVAARHVDLAEAGEVGEPAGQLVERAALGRVLAEHLGLLAHLPAGGHREVGEPALGARRRAELVGQHLGGQPRAHARRVQHADGAVRLGGQRGRRLARLRLAALGQPEVALVAGGLAVAEEPEFDHASVSSKRFSPGMRRTDPHP